MKIYGDKISGNCLKVKYTADFLKLEYEWVDVDISRGDSRTEAFLSLSPMGQVPVVEFASGKVLAQSNAIVRYLAAGTPLLPTDTFAAAKVDEAMFWEQYSHEPYIAVCRFHMVYEGRKKDERDDWRVERGEAALDFMDVHLRDRVYWCEGGLSAADIALVAYTRVAHEGGFDVAARASLCQWIKRVESQLKIQ